MLRGLLSGLFWGICAVVLVVGLASLLAPLPATVVPQTEAVDTTTGSDAQDSGKVGTTSEADAARNDSTSPEASAPVEEDQAPLADTDSAPQPNTQTPMATMTAPESSDSGAGVAVEGDSPVDPQTSVTAPTAPNTDEAALIADEDTSITTNPAQPEAPQAPVGGAFVTPSTPTEQADDQDLTPDAEAGAMSASEEETSALKPAGDLKEKFPQHESSRLPSVGGDATAASAPPATPFELNSEPFDNDDGRPLMAIVLLDDGAGPLALDTLKEFPYPVSIAVNTLAPQVATRAAAYRDLGYEVLAMVNLPAAAAPADVEVALEAHLAVLPQAVGVMEGDEDGLQGAKPISDQVTQVLLGSGHGLVMFPKGLSTAQKLASREGVPAATIFRDFDGKGQNGSVMRRFLDQAAFKAAQEGGVIMVGRLKEDTIATLLVWGLQDRAGSVALAPVSAVLRAKNP